MTTEHGEDDARDRSAAETALRSLLGAPTLAASTRSAHLRSVRELAASLPAPAGSGHARARPPVLAGGWIARLASGFAAAGLLVVMGAGGVVAASAGALPGTLAYDAKLAGERAALSLRGSEEAGSRYLVVLAERRLDEAERLARTDAADHLIDTALAAHAVRLLQARDRALPHDRAREQVVTAAERTAGRLEHLITGGAAPPGRRTCPGGPRARQQLDRPAWQQPRRDARASPPRPCRATRAPRGRTPARARRRGRSRSRPQRTAGPRTAGSARSTR